MKNKTSPPQIKPGDYPFLNPIIVTKDDGIIDGQHRYQVCEMYGCKVEFIKLDYSKEELRSKECIEKIVEIKDKQRKKLDDYFKKYNIGYKKQIDTCSSDDKIKYLYSYKDKLKDDAEYWKYLSESYIMSSNNYKYKKELVELFTSLRPQKEYLMNDEEKKIIDSLPQKINIYRGMSTVEADSSDFGISWTLNKAIADKFADSYLHNYDTRSIPHVVKGISISKSEIIAYFNGREEEEIIYIHQK